jgi:hypothetical protein
MFIASSQRPEVDRVVGSREGHPEMEEYASDSSELLKGVGNMSDNEPPEF